MAALVVVEMVWPMATTLWTFSRLTLSGSSGFVYVIS